MANSDVITGRCGCSEGGADIKALLQMTFLTAQTQITNNISRCSFNFNIVLQRFIN